MNATHTRLAAAASLTLAASLALAGCQSEAGPTAAAPPVAGQPVAAPTTQPGSTVDGKVLGDRLVAAARAAKTVRVTALAGGSSRGVVADVAFRSPERTDLQLEVPKRQGRERLQVRLVDGTAYLSNPQQTGPEWVSVSPTSQNPLAKSALGFVQQLLRQGPTGQANVMARSAVTVVGSEPLDGVRTTHYRVAVPAETLLNQLETAAGPLGQSDPDATRMLGMLRQMVKGVTVTQDVWVGPQDRMHRVALRLPNVFGSSAVKAMPGITMSFSQWGSPVNISAPPAAATKPVDEVWGSTVPDWGHGRREVPQV